MFVSANLSLPRPTSWQSPLAYILPSICGVSMFTLSRHLLCPSTKSQLSLNSSSTLLHPYVMKFAAQESRLRQSCFCRRENPNPHVSTTNITSGATASTDKPPRSRPNAAAAEIKDTGTKGYFCLPRCPKTERQCDSCVIKKQLSRLILFQSHIYNINQRQVRVKIASTGLPASASDKS